MDRLCPHHVPAAASTAHPTAQLGKMAATRRNPTPPAGVEKTAGFAGFAMKLTCVEKMQRCNKSVIDGTARAIRDTYRAGGRRFRVEGGFG